MVLLGLSQSTGSTIMFLIRSFMIKYFRGAICPWGYSAFFKALMLILISLRITNTAMGDPRATVAGQFCNGTRAASTDTFAIYFVPAMANLNSKVNSYGYGTNITGVNPNAVYALGQCYGDLNSTDCKLCFSEIRSQLPKCYPQIGGRLFLDGCFGRYENFSFFDEIFHENDTAVCSSGKNGSSASTIFDHAVKEAINYVSSQARNNKGFAVGSASVSASTVYALAQCWENLNKTLCSSCLDAAASSISSCSPAAEGRALYAGCFMRYSTKLFWNVYGPPSGSSGKSNRAWITLSSLLGVLIIIIIGLFIWERRGLWRRKKFSLEDLHGLELAKAISEFNLNFQYEELMKATDNFSLSNKLGQGSYGTVYKGVLYDGKQVAIKRLFLNTRQWIDQFFNEVDLINKVRHKNLVRLLGCSVDGPESLLVYEFHCNRSLDLFIFDVNQAMVLDWKLRCDIILGVAEGLSYLHEESGIRIIHRDIKASNILLDEKLKPKITDFGLARSFAQDQTHLTTGIAGTLGYLAPEYIVHGHLTEKADVYSYGVLVLEIVTGKRCSNPVVSPSEHSLPAKVWKHYKEKRLADIVDARIYDNERRDDIAFIVSVGLLCIQADPESRPTMSGVVELLRSNTWNQAFVLYAPPFLDIPTMEVFEQGECSNMEQPMIQSRER